ncbi:hypothetical protein WN55_06331 [Dufourea novaeangliae]|uniref:Uncharacterized protein n=1 Tax=Dufourea novaeangliae TaxID=178035 RepID=A0A154PQD2_DUFNO|nr:hypothetical protein WN55_06331 [Dufourea novaeangliae]
MGGRQSRRSVDITPTPKKEGLPADGSVGDAAAPGDGKLERIEETDTKPTTNGIAPHTDSTEDKDKDKDETTEKEKDKEKQEEVKAEETKQESAGESPAETTAEVTTPTEPTAASPNTTATSPESKETKKKEKMKKKWSFRSISFSKKDKNKPAREEAPKNGDVTKEEILTEVNTLPEYGYATSGRLDEEYNGKGTGWCIGTCSTNGEQTYVKTMESVSKAGRSVGTGVYRVVGAFARGARRVLSYVPLLGVAAVPPEVEDAKSSAGGEEAENGSATAGSPVEEKSAVSSPSAETEAAPASAAPSTETKEDAAATGASATATAASSPADEKQEEPTPSAPTPVPVEENKEEVEKIGVEKRVVETTPESEAPVENNVAHDSTTESSEEKIAPPAVLTEIPASPPSAPAITEDVASVAKAIEEIDISDKAVAAATIECTTNEIIADAHYQNNVNE